MRLKLDENLSRYLREDLVRLDHDVDTVADEGLTSQTDPVVARAAKAEGRILLTLDIEFADLRKYPPGSHPGIVLFRPSSRGVQTVRELVLSFVSTAPWEKLEGCVVVVQPDRVRVRAPVRSS